MDRENMRSCLGILRTRTPSAGLGTADNCDPACFTAGGVHSMFSGPPHDTLRPDACHRLASGCAPCVVRQPFE
jgi:hypothetical protein